MVNKKRHNLICYISYVPWSMCNMLAIAATRLCIKLINHFVQYNINSPDDSISWTVYDLTLCFFYLVFLVVLLVNIIDRIGI